MSILKIQNKKSSVGPIFQLIYGAPQGSVLGPLLVILYTTSLSTIISNSAQNLYLYADDTRLFLSFSPADVSRSITHPENTISNVSNWMSSNSLSPNRCKTAFLIFGLPRPLSKPNNPTIHPHLTMSYSHLLILLILLAIMVLLSTKISSS